MPRPVLGHVRIGHGAITDLGFDWSRIAGETTPRLPRTIHLPASVDDVVLAVTETRERGERLVVRGRGHSSNNLVTPEGGVVLCTDRLDRIDPPDLTAMTVTVQSGALVSDVDRALEPHGVSLPVAPDHHDITVGGYASVGGLGPTSIHAGLFVDNVVDLEVVGWDGRVQRAAVGDDPSARRWLASLGRHGVLTAMTLRVVPVDKRTTLLRNDRRLLRRVDEFVAGVADLVGEPDGVVAARSVWADLPGRKDGSALRLGQVAAYRLADATAARWARRNLAYRALRRIGRRAGQRPARVDELLKYAGTASILASPRYATLSDVELATEGILDHTVGDPTRMFVSLVPLDQFDAVFTGVYDVLRRVRSRTGALTFLTLHAKGIRSSYLGRGDATRPFVELMAVVGTVPDLLDEPTLDGLVGAIDEVCLRHGAYRYLHTRTSSDPAVRARLDPSNAYAGSPELLAG